PTLGGPQLPGRPGPRRSRWSGTSPCSTWTKTRVEPPGSASDACAFGLRSDPLQDPAAETLGFAESGRSVVGHGDRRHFFGTDPNAGQLGPHLGDVLRRGWGYTAFGETGAHHLEQ